MRNINIILPAVILLLSVLGCGGKTEIRIIKSGRLEYVEHLRYGPAGTHGSSGWYVEDRELKVNGYRWQPENIDLKNLTCESSPSEAVEALKCTSYEAGKEVIYIIRLLNNKPELVTASEFEYIQPDDTGEWADDGHWLIFRNYFYNVETSEKREIKGLPGEPDKYFIAASPDLETIIFRDFCYSLIRDDSGNVLNEEEHNKQCEKFYERSKNDIEAFRLIEAKTGSVKILELKTTDYPFAKNPHPYVAADWLNEFRSKLVWEKDKDGRDRLVYPK